MNKQPKYIAYNTTEGRDKTYYHRIGAAWENKDGSLTIQMHSLPVAGKVLLFAPPKLEPVKAEG